MATELSTDVQSVIDNIKKKSNTLKWVIGLATLFLIVPVIWFMAYAILGVAALGISLAIAGGVGAVIYYGTPNFLNKLATRQIDKAIEEANKNPIPTLWVEHERDAKEIEEFSKSIVDYETEIGNCHDKAKQLAKDLTEQDLTDFKNDVKTMEEDLELQKAELANLRKDHKASETEIKRASAIWDLGMAVNRANSKNMSARREDTLTRIRKETALDSVRNSMNRNKAQLRQRIEHRAALSDSPVYKNNWVETPPVGNVYQIPNQKDSDLNNLSAPLIDMTQKAPR